MVCFNLSSSAKVGLTCNSANRMPSDNPVKRNTRHKVSRGGYTASFMESISGQRLQHYGCTRRQNSEKDKSAAPTLHVIHLASWTLSHVRKYSISGHQVAAAFLGALEDKTKKRQKLKIFCSPHVTPHQPIVPLM
ncbi:hypothetical protein V6N11_074166 [Hibiscus sabdariffa]|uniref:Uncharacterized protein n=1 Tax=Hibiscus sabdariffa TaxID=183260 RepID=A0ABR2NWP1_9ROSI